MRVLILLATIAAGFGCAAHDRSAGEACAVTADCKTDLACLRGICDTPAMCPAEAPIECSDGSGCCQTATPYCCAKDGLCHVNAANCNGSPPTCANKACATSAGCCDGFTCSRFGRICRAGKNLVTGEACTDDAQCISRSCSGYCTKACAKTADCGPANYCLDSAEGFQCIPFCRNNADCAVYGPDTTCQTAMDPAGLNLHGCFAK